jgi:hypothetical protein
MIAVAAIGVLAAVVGVVANQVIGTTAPRPEAQALAQAQASTPGPVGVAAAYRYPRNCLDVTIDAANPAFAAVRLNRVSPCWRYGVYVTAIFHRVAGVWRMVLDATGTGCPMRSVPAPVRAQLGMCDSDRPATPGG